MYISKNTLFLILIVIITIIHLLIHIIEFVKIYNSKAKKPFSGSTLKEKIKELITTLLNPDNSIISGIKEFIINSLHTDDNKENDDHG